MIGRWLVIVCLALCCFSCQYNEVEVNDIRNFQIRKVENSRLFLSFDVLLNNPNSYQIKVLGTDLNCAINGRNLGNLRLDEPLVIPPKNEGFVPVNASLTTKGAAASALSVLVTSLISQSVDIHLSGDVRGGFFLFPKTIEIDHRERVELNRGNLW